MRTVLMAGMVSRGAMVKIDPWGVNPLAAEVRQAEGPLYAVRVRDSGQPPKLFTAGSADLPAFTAAGFDPALLARLPYRCRHFAAAVASPVEAQALFEEYAGDPHAQLPHPGLDDAVRRMHAWLMGSIDQGGQGQ